MFLFYSWFELIEEGGLSTVTEKISKSFFQSFTSVSCHCVRANHCINQCQFIIFTSCSYSWFSKPSFKWWLIDTSVNCKSSRHHCCNSSDLHERSSRNIVAIRKKSVQPISSRHILFVSRRWKDGDRHHQCYQDSRSITLTSWLLPLSWFQLV